MKQSHVLTFHINCHPFYIIVKQLNVFGGHTNCSHYQKSCHPLVVVQTSTENYSGVTLWPVNPKDTNKSLLAVSSCMQKRVNSDHLLDLAFLIGNWRISYCNRCELRKLGQNGVDGDNLYYYSILGLNPIADLSVQSLHVHLSPWAGLLWILCFPCTTQRHGSTGYSELLIRINVSVNGCSPC